MRKRRAIRAALILRRWCNDAYCDECPLCGRFGCRLKGKPMFWRNKWEG